MKGKIDKGGYLHLERAGKMKYQYCPIANVNNEYQKCGDWCPLFGEPENVQKTFEAVKGKIAVYLKICSAEKTFVFELEDFTDERANG